MLNNLHPGQVPAKGKMSAFLAKTTSRRTSAIVGGGALVLGIMMGSGVSGASSTSEIEQLSADLATTTQQAEVLAKDVELLEDKNLKIQKSEESKATTIAALKVDVADATAASKTQEQKITELETALASAVAAAAPPAPIAAPEPVAAAAPAPVTNTYYKNCTAVRNAGAAPIRSGDPGYGSHLDRDGDGIGCE